MKNDLPFDLPAFMLSNFSRVDFGGDLFGQWPIGLRFEQKQTQILRFAQEDKTKEENVP
jgi:hypothetical protein